MYCKGSMLRAPSPTGGATCRGRGEALPTGRWLRWEAARGDRGCGKTKRQGSEWVTPATSPFPANRDGCGGEKEGREANPPRHDSRQNEPNKGETMPKRTGDAAELEL